jgi:flagellin
MRINQNIMAFNAYRNLSSTNNVMGKSLEKLSSGFRINRAADDAAGLVISQGLRAQVSGLRQATRNAQDGISVVQTAEGALNEVHSMLNRMRDLAVQASNSGSSDSAARGAAQEEANQLRAELDRMAGATKFGSMQLLDGNFGVKAGSVVASSAPGTITFAAGDDFTVDGVAVELDAVTAATGDAAASYLTERVNAALSAAGNAAAGKVEFKFEDNRMVFESKDTSGTVALGDGTNTPLATLGFGAELGTPAAQATGTGGRFQVGANNGDFIDVSITSVSVAVLGLDGVNVDLENDAEASITRIQTAIDTVSSSRGELGAVQNRFESTISNLQVTTENLAASESRIRDTDMALEMVSFTRHQILLQAGTAMLGQANGLPQSVLRLLG